MTGIVIAEDLKTAITENKLYYLLKELLKEQGKQQLIFKFTKQLQERKEGTQKS
ncbi:hypothetical protein [Candidatus Coxiella mudrowiae]|uniref:hypothetical protein n=1 Tax=Candidatus Coxiella mudrowiae TaxID=2054173 RepID=UPI0012FEF64D|nr:hypothetical protein [Candidatus Coxiella mudrowiae]